ncbi:MAG: toxin-antitoxin system HicB family antitoxin [Balneolaceae bacterium]|nr:toxin-antitoxin system HicB family antitoxin [Balneolaceae bacterium]
MSTLSVRLPDSLHKKLKELAEKEGVSMNQLITLAVSEKMSALLTVDYLKERAERADRDAFNKILEQVPDTEPEEYDRLD